MDIIKQYQWLLIVALVVLAGVFFFLNRLYRNDVQALTDFSAAYQKFDKTIADFSVSSTDDLDSKTDEALVELTEKATVRLSSLIKNDAELMNQAREVADLSGRELASLKIYKGASRSKNADSDGLAKEYGDLTSKRKAAYARFRQLGE